MADEKDSNPLVPTVPSPPPSFGTITMDQWRAALTAMDMSYGTVRVGMELRPINNMAGSDPNSRVTWDTPTGYVVTAVYDDPKTGGKVALIKNAETNHLMVVPMGTNGWDDLTGWLSNLISTGISQLANTTGKNTTPIDENNLFVMIGQSYDSKTAVTILGDSKGGAIAQGITAIIKAGIPNLINVARQQGASGETISALNNLANIRNDQLQLITNNAPSAQDELMDQGLDITKINTTGISTMQMVSTQDFVNRTGGKRYFANPDGVVFTYESSNAPKDLGTFDRAIWGHRMLNELAGNIKENGGTWNGLRPGIRQWFDTRAVINESAAYASFGLDYTQPTSSAETKARLIAAVIGGSRVLPDDNNIDNVVIKAIVDTFAWHYNHDPNKIPANLLARGLATIGIGVGRTIGSQNPITTTVVSDTDPKYIASVTGAPLNPMDSGFTRVRSERDETGVFRVLDVKRDSTGVIKELNTYSFDGYVKNEVNTRAVGEQTDAVIKNTLPNGRVITARYEYSQNRASVSIQDPNDSVPRTVQIGIDETVDFDKKTGDVFTGFGRNITTSFPTVPPVRPPPTPAPWPFVTPPSVVAPFIPAPPTGSPGSTPTPTPDPVPALPTLPTLPTAPTYVTPTPTPGTTSTPNNPPPTPTVAPPTGTGSNGGITPPSTGSPPPPSTSVPTPTPNNPPPTPAVTPGAGTGSNVGISPPSIRPPSLDITRDMSSVPIGVRDAAYAIADRNRNYDTVLDPNGPNRWDIYVIVGYNARTQTEIVKRYTVDNNGNPVNDPRAGGNGASTEEVPAGFFTIEAIFGDLILVRRPPLIVDLPQGGGGGGGNTNPYTDDIGGDDDDGGFSHTLGDSAHIPLTPSPVPSPTSTSGLTPISTPPPPTGGDINPFPSTITPSTGAPPATTPKNPNTGYIPPTGDIDPFFGLIPVPPPSPPSVGPQYPVVGYLPPNGDIDPHAATPSPFYTPPTSGAGVGDPTGGATGAGGGASIISTPTPPPAPSVPAPRVGFGSGAGFGFGWGVELPEFDIHLVSSNLYRWRAKNEPKAKGSESSIYG